MLVSPRKRTGMDERARIAMLSRVLASFAPGIEVAIGDDAAVLQCGHATGGRLVWTIDEQVEGSHFRREWMSWRSVGFRSFMAAASDLAAMGAEPWAALSALALPDDVDDAALGEIARGQAEAAAEVGAPVIGGNLTRGPVLSVVTTLLGTCDRAVLRSGARPGDQVWLAGHVGLAAAGLQALRADAAGDVRLAPALDAFRSPRALVSEGRRMAPVAHAAIDISDGLAGDVGHLADASGVRIVLEEDALCADGALTGAAQALGLSALELALYGGEDYALVASGPEAPPPGFRRIGVVETGRGLFARGANGDRALEARGYDHFVAGPLRTSTRSGA